MEPKGQGTQNPWRLGSFAFGFPGVWVPSPLGSLALGSLAFGFPGFKGEGAQR